MGKIDRKEPDLYRTLTTGKALCEVPVSNLAVHEACAERSPDVLVMSIKISFRLARIHSSFSPHLMHLLTLFVLLLSHNKKAFHSLRVLAVMKMVTWNDKMPLQPFRSRVRHFSCWTVQHHNSPVDSARELLKPSTDSGSLLVADLLTFVKFWISFFCRRHIWGRFLHFWPRSLGPGRQPNEPFLAQVFFGN